MWVLGEVFGSLFFSVYSLGPGVISNTDFSFGYIGYTVAHLAILYPIVASFGVYGASFVCALFALILYLGVHKNRYSAPVYPLSFLGVLLALYLLVPSPPRTEEGRKIMAIDTRFDINFLNQPGADETKIREELSAVLEANKYDPDIILLPEDSRLTTQFTTANEASAFFKTKIGTSTLVVDTARVTDERGMTVLRAFYHDLRNNRVYLADKQYLIPQGEHVTYLSSFIIKLLGNDELLSLMNQNQNYHSGALVDYKNFPADLPGLLFCSESIVPSAVRGIAAKRQSSLVLHPVSHARFHRTSFFNDQLDAMLRVQAIWNNKTIVSASNFGEGKVYYNSGDILRGEVKTSTKFWTLVEYNI